MAKPPRGHRSILFFAGALLLAGCPGSSSSGSAPGGQPGTLAADFSGSPRAGQAPLAVAFSDLSGGSPTTWSWDFGDGGMSSAQDPGHTFTTPGTYTVSLTVTDASDADTEAKVDYITVEEPPPIADFSGSPLSGQAPLQVAFSDLSTGSVSGWSWDFGDGGSSTAQNPSHTFATAGTYTVALTASGPGGSDTETKVDYVTVSEPPPVADFSGSPLSGQAPLLVAFSDLTTGSVSGWSWDFGDGGASTVQNPSHTYAASGTYTVALTASGPGGSDTETKVGYVTVTSGGTDTTPPVITCPGDVSVPATGTDGFDGTSLDSSWSLLNPTFMTFSVSGGELHMQPTMGGPPFSWFADEEGPLIYRTVTGDFTATATLRVEDPNNPGQTPPAPNRFGGLIARDPGSVPGDRNSVHVVLGAGANPPPVAEDKSTDGSVSDFVFHSITQTRGDVRIVRTGSLFSLEYRAPGAPSFQVLRAHNRPDLPATLHVGPMIYSFSTPPDVIAHFDQVSITNAMTVVNYPAPTVTDDTDPSPTVVCSPPSGSAFPLGTTTVVCTATDASGNSSTCSFTVTVNAVAPLTLDRGARRVDPYGIFLRLFPVPAPGRPLAPGSTVEIILR